MIQIEWNGRKWYWPKDDIRMKNVNKWSLDFLEVLPHLKRRNGAIQAGGACGLWPVLMSEYFHRVFSFEPHPDNYEALAANVKDCKNIQIWPMALGEKRGWCNIHRHDSEKNNNGAFYTKEVEAKDTTIESVPQVPIDEMTLSEPIDFIQLDIEGNELPVLKGALKTINAYHPVIMVEDKNLFHDKDIGHKKGEVGEFLKTLGYHKVMEARRDVVFKYESDITPVQDRADSEPA